MPRQVVFTNDVNGTILMRQETGTSATGSPVEYHFYLDGIAVGDLSNNGTSDVDYGASITEHTRVQSNGFFRDGQAWSSALSYADFDQSYNPINGLNYAAAGSSYTVMAGDTLASIAGSLWGDASLWYLIAEANGLSSASTLSAGQSLTIPSKVANVHNNASTYRVYDPNKFIGNISPTAPAPPKSDHGCGVIGQVILMVIAIVVTVVLQQHYLDGLIPTLFGSTTAGSMATGAIAAVGGSLVSQGVGLATGLQKSFDWAGLGMAAIGGAVGGVAGNSGLLGNITNNATVNAVLNGMAASVVTQGIGVATGLQSKFDWVGVAAAGAGAGVGNWVGGELMGLKGDWITTNATGQTVASGLTRFVSGVAGDIANAATRTLINGSDFGDNILAALPDTIGQTIGNMVAGGISQPSDPYGDETVTVTGHKGDWYSSGGSDDGASQPTEFDPARGRAMYGPGAVEVSQLPPPSGADFDTWAASINSNGMQLQSLGSLDYTYHGPAWAQNEDAYLRHAAEEDEASARQSVAGLVVDDGGSLRDPVTGMETVVVNGNGPVYDPGRWMYYKDRFGGKHRFWYDETDPNWTQLPRLNGAGFYVYGTDRSGRQGTTANAQWGKTKTSIAVLEAAAYLEGIGFNAPLGIGNMTLQDADRFPPHSSHVSGLDIDIRPVRVDRLAERLGDFRNNPQYDRAATQQIVDAFLATGMVKVIYFNDPQIRGVSFMKGHYDHIHVTLKP